MFPPWLSLAPLLPGREDEITRGLALLREQGRLVITGVPGIGKTAVAGAVLARFDRSVVAVSAAGCEDGPDLLRAVGHALGARPCGDEGQVRLALRRFAVLFVDDIGTDAVAAEAVRLAEEMDLSSVHVREHAPDSLVLGPLAGLPPELGALDGNPGLARLCSNVRKPLADALVLGDTLRWLVPYPMGVPAAAPALVPTPFLRPDGQDRLVLRRVFGARLEAPTDAPARALAAVEPLVDTLARGGHLPAPPDPADLLLIRLLARQLPDHADRLRAAAVRLAARFGQMHVARALAAEAPPRSPAGAALLLWADAEVLLLGGVVDEAMEQVEAASRAFVRADDAAGKATMLRRLADGLLVRGDVARAESLYESARALYRALGQPIGVAATQRGVAALALTSGVSVGIAALHDGVEAALQAHPAPLEHANLRFGQAALAAVRGELATAESLLKSIDVAGAPPLLLANLARRRGDLAMRRGDTEAALRDAEEAARLYATLGETVAEAGAWRLAGDALGSAGRCADALRRYATAIRLQVRTRDLRGIARTLDHAATVAEWAGEPDLARRWRDQRAEVTRLAE